jgi:hypothetical protein
VRGQQWSKLVNWNAVGAIGQLLEALVVLGGVVLVIRQLQQLKREFKKTKWEALQWSLTLFSAEDVHCVHRYMNDDNFVGDGTDDDIIAALQRVLEGLHQIELAIQDGFLDEDLYLLSMGRVLSALAKERLEPDKRQNALFDLPGIPSTRLIRAAYKWDLVHPVNLHKAQNGAETSEETDIVHP